MNTDSHAPDIYDKPEVHDDWIAVYRTNPLQHALDDRIMERFARYLQITPDKRILDAGCGTGTHTLRLAARGCQCVGVDISEYVLGQAKELVAAHGLSDRVSFVQSSLEDLPFDDAEFDAIHCRGVLMHIPCWERALEELCRVLKRGGRIVIAENNDRSVESLLVRLARVFRRSESRMVKLPCGIEFWPRKKGDKSPMYRVAHIRYLIGELRRRQVRLIATLATHFWDINRFPAGLRSAAVRYNSCWFSLRLPALLSSGNAVVAQKCAE